MKFKAKNILMISFLAIAGVFGVTSILTNKNANEMFEAKEVKAAGSEKYYLKGDAEGLNWNTGDYSNGFNYDSAIGKYFITYTLEVGNYIQAYCTDNARWINASGVNFLSTAKVTNAFQQWADTGVKWKCLVAGTYTFYLVEGAKDYKDCGYAWSISDVLDLVSSTASASTFRVWGRATFDGWYSNQAITALRTTISGNQTLYAMNTIYNSDDKLYYWYADVSLSIDGFQFIRVSPDKATIWNYSVWTNKENVSPTEVYYVNSGKSGSDYNVSVGSPDNPSADFFAKVIEPFCTCLKSSFNGYEAYSDLNTHWYSKLTSAEKTSLSSKNISDYTYTDYHNNGDSYDGISKNGTVSVSTKWAALGNMNSSGNPNHSAIGGFAPFSMLDDSEESLHMVIIIVASSVALMSLTALSVLIIKKRKEQQ